MERRTNGEGGWPKGARVDGAPETRPGVPLLRRPVPDPGAHWVRPEQQRGAALLARAGLREATPVFGTAQPARGLAGAVRRLAYRVPEHRTSRWALLLAADRLDVLSLRLARGAWLAPAALALAVGYAAASRALARR